MYQTSKTNYPIGSDAYEKLFKIGFNTWKARLRNEPESEVTIKLHNVDASFDKENIKSEISKLTEICSNNDGFLSAGTSFFVENVLYIVTSFESWSEGTVKDVMNLYNYTHEAPEEEQQPLPSGLEEQVVRAIAAQLLNPLETLHSKGRIFRDLRCKNIMVTSEGKVQLQVFTLPSLLQDKSPIYKDSLFWASPELLLQDRIPGSSMTPGTLASMASVGPAADVWALGITLLEMALGEPPMNPDLTPVQIFQSVFEGEQLSLPADVAPLWSRGFKEVVSKCLVKDPSARATIAELRAHPFFSGAPGPEFIHQNLLSAIPSGDGRWKTLDTIRAKQEQQRQERKEVAAQLAQQAMNMASFMQSVTDLPDFSNNGGPNLGGPSLGGPTLGAGHPLFTAPISNINSNIPSTPSLGGGPTLGGALGNPQVPVGASPALNSQPIAEDFNRTGVPTPATTLPLSPPQVPHRSVLPIVDNPFLNELSTNSSKPASNPTTGGQTATGTASTTVTAEPTRGRFRFVAADATTSNAAPSASTSSQAPPVIFTGTQTSTQVSTAASTPLQASESDRKSRPGSESGPIQTPQYNVPLEAYLGETDREYAVIVRALPGTSVSMSLEGRNLIITGQVPPLAPPLLRMIVSTERPTSKFERKIRLPYDIDPLDITKEILKEASTIVIRIKKAPKSIHLGDDLF